MPLCQLCNLCSFVRSKIRYARTKINFKRRRDNASKVLEWERSMNEIPMTVLQIKKLRRRVEDALRKSDVKTLFQVAKLLGLRIQKDLEKIKNDIPKNG